MNINSSGDVKVTLKNCSIRFVKRPDHHVSDSTREIIEGADTKPVSTLYLPMEIIEAIISQCNNSIPSVETVPEKRLSPFIVGGIVR
jgi:hypothetical protein